MNWFVFTMLFFLVSSGAHAATQDDPCAPIQDPDERAKCYLDRTQSPSPQPPGPFQNDPPASVYVPQTKNPYEFVE